LHKDLEAYREFSIRSITLRIAQDQDALAEEEIENKRAKAEYEATKSLEDRNAVPKRELEKHEAAFNSSTQRLLRNKGVIAELSNSLEAVRAGTFLGDGNNDSPYSKQRMDQLVIEISLAETACNEAKNRLSGIDLQIEEERERIAKAEKFELFAPYDALVWRMPSIEGSTIVIDSELVILLDCESVFLDVTVSESQFSNVKPGDEIRYQLMGGTAQYVGTVFALRGSGSVQGDLNLAASVSKDSKREFRIWIHADPADLGLTPQTFFQIGRRVVVKIPRKWNALNFLNWFINVF
jgi:multidrug resistance efflux pump